MSIMKKSLIFKDDTTHLHAALIKTLFKRKKKNKSSKTEVHISD